VDGVDGESVPSGRVLGGEEPVPAGGGTVPTAACGTTNARIFAVEGRRGGGGTAGMGAVAELTTFGGRFVALSSESISDAVGGRMSGRASIARVRLIAGNDEGIALGAVAPATIVAARSGRACAGGGGGVGAGSGDDTFDGAGDAVSGAGAAGSWPSSRSTLSATVG